MLKVGEMGVGKMGVDETGPTLVDKPFFYSLDVQNNYGTIYKMIMQGHIVQAPSRNTQIHKSAQSLVLDGRASPRLLISFEPQLWPLIDIKIPFPLNILRLN